MKDTIRRGVVRPVGRIGRVPHRTRPEFEEFAGARAAPLEIALEPRPFQAPLAIFPYDLDSDVGVLRAGLPVIRVPDVALQELFHGRKGDLVPRSVVISSAIAGAWARTTDRNAMAAA